MIQELVAYDISKIPNCAYKSTISFLFNSANGLLIPGAPLSIGYTSDGISISCK